MLYSPGVRLYSPLPFDIAMRYITRSRLPNSPTLATLVVLHAIGKPDKVLEELEKLNSLMGLLLRLINYAAHAALDAQIQAKKDS